MLKSNGGGNNSDRSKNELISAMWWKLSVKERDNHYHLIKVQLLSPFLFSRVFQDQKWILWCLEAKLVQEERLSSFDELSEEEHNSIDLVEDAMTKLKSHFSSNCKSPYQRFKEIMDDLDCCRECPDLQTAVKNVKAKGWFASIRSTITEETILKKDAAILLTTWLYCDYIKVLHGGGKPMDCYGIESSIVDMEERKEEGKMYVQRKEYTKAVSVYSALLAERCYNYILYGNRAQCFLNLQKFGLARDDGRRTIILSASWEKGQYRYAQALGELRLYDKGISALRKAISLCTENKDDLLRLIRTFQDKVVKMSKTKPRWKGKQYGSTRDIPALVDASSDDDSTGSDFSSFGSSDESDDYSRSDMVETSSEDEKLIRESLQRSPPPPLLSDTEEHVIDEQLIPCMFKKFLKNRNMGDERKARSNSKSQKKRRKEDVKAMAPENGKAIKEKTKVDLITDSTSTILKQGTGALLEERFPAAIRFYGQAVQALEKENKLSWNSTVILFYSLGTAYLKNGTATDLCEAQKHYNLIIEKYDAKFILAHYGIGKALFKQNRFYDVRAALTTADDLLDKHGMKARTWPCSTTIIKESNKNILKTLIRTLLAASCFPPRPVATCRFQDCKQLKTYIYFSDPNYKGFIRLKCSEMCVIDYHIVCWKKYKSDQLSGRLEKDLINEGCLTPCCSGFIHNIRIYNEHSKDENDFKMRLDSDRKKSSEPGICRVDKASRVTISSLRHLRRLEARKIRKQEHRAKKVKKEEEALRKEKEIDEVQLENTIMKLSRGSSDASAQDYDPNTDVGTFILKKEEKDEWFAVAQKTKFKKRKSKVKDQPPAAEHLLDMRFERNCGAPDSAILSLSWGNVLDEANNRPLDEETDPRETEFQVSSSIISLLLANGFIHFEQQLTLLESFLGDESMSFIESYGGFRRFLERFPFVTFETDDRNLVYLSEKHGSIESLNNIAREIINESYLAPEECMQHRMASNNAVSDSQQNMCDRLSEFSLQDKIQSHKAPAEFVEDSPKAGYQSQESLLGSPPSAEDWISGDRVSNRYAVLSEIGNGQALNSSIPYYPTRHFSPFTRAPFMHVNKPFNFPPPMGEYFTSDILNNSMRIDTSFPNQREFIVDPEVPCVVASCMESSASPKEKVTSSNAFSESHGDCKEDFPSHQESLSSLIQEGQNNSNALSTFVDDFNINNNTVESASEEPTDNFLGKGTFSSATSTSQTDDSFHVAASTVDDGVSGHTQEGENIQEIVQNDQTAKGEADGNINYRKLLRKETQAKKELQVKLESAVDSLKQQKTRSVVEADGLKRQIQDLQMENQELQKEIQRRKDAQENDLKTSQAERKRHLEEMKSLQLKLNQSNESKLRVTIKNQEDEIRALKDELQMARTEREKQVADNEDIINKMSNCVTEQSKRAQMAEGHFLETKLQMMKFMYAPLFARIKFALDMLKNLPPAMLTRQLMDLLTAWDQYNAVVSMEYDLLKCKIAMFQRDVDNGSVLNYKELPEIYLPRITSPAMPPALPVPSLQPPGAHAHQGEHVPQVSKPVTLPSGDSLPADTSINGLAAVSSANGGGSHVTSSRTKIQNTKEYHRAVAPPPKAETRSQPTSSRQTLQNGSLSAVRAHTPQASEETTSKRSEALEKLVLRIGVKFSELTREQIENYISEFRMSRPDARLSGLSPEVIIKGVEVLIRRKKEQGHDVTHDHKSGIKTVPPAVSPSKVTEHQKGATPSHGVKMNGKASEASVRKKPWGGAGGNVKQTKGAGKLYGLEEPCVICHEDMESGFVKLMCGHTFHYVCIQSWLNSNRTCPTCRRYALLPEEFPALK